jgi:putative MFS transporter
MTSTKGPTVSVLEPEHQYTGPETPTLAERFERLPFTSYQRKLAAILATAFAIDAIDVIMLGSLLAPISQDLGLSTTTAGYAASAGLAGMGLGATVAGLLADRFGRRPVLVNSMLLWGTATLLTAFAWDLPSFMVFRFITGLGLGAELPVAFALLAEFMPAPRRAVLTGWMNVLSASGYVTFNALSLGAVAIAGAMLGWRAMFVVMFVAAMFAFYVRRAMPESPRWLEARGWHDRAEAGMTAIERNVERAYGQPLPPPVPVAASTPVKTAAGCGLRDLFARGYASRTVVAWTLWLFVMLAYYGINTWVGRLLVERGVSISNSILIVLLMSIAGVPAGWVTGYTMDRIGRKPVLVSTLILVSGAALAYGNAASFWVVVGTGAIMNFGLASVGTALYAYTPELFPTRTRGLGLGTSSTIGRISAVGAPLAVPPILLAWGYTGTFVAFACCFALGASVLLTLGPESKGRALEEVTG